MGVKRGRVCVQGLGQAGTSVAGADCAPADVERGAHQLPVHQPGSCLRPGCRHRVSGPRQHSPCLPVVVVLGSAWCSHQTTEEAGSPDCCCCAASREMHGTCAAHACELSSAARVSWPAPKSSSKVRCQRIVLFRLVVLPHPDVSIAACITCTPG